MTKTIVAQFTINNTTLSLIQEGILKERQLYITVTTNNQMVDYKEYGNDRWKAIQTYKQIKKALI